jgi:hypothetical protein
MHFCNLCLFFIVKSKEENKKHQHNKMGQPLAKTMYQANNPTEAKSL